MNLIAMLLLLNLDWTLVDGVKPGYNPYWAFETKPRLGKSGGVLDERENQREHQYYF